MSLVGELAASVPNKLSGRYCNLHNGMLVEDAPVEEVGNFPEWRIADYFS
jgi:hypothetical protein